MKRKIKLALIITRNSKSSRSSRSLALHLLESLSSKYQISLVLVDDLLPKSLIISENEMKKHYSYIPYDTISSHPRVHTEINLSEITLKDIRSMFDVAIVAIYNEFGEDGKLLGVLDAAGVRYFGPGLKTSSLCFDKQFTKAVLAYNEISVPRGIEINKWTLNKSNLAEQLKNFSFPLMIKPVSSGASRGASIANSYNDLEKNLTRAFELSDEVLIEEYIQGEEFTVGVLGHYSNAQVLPSVSIKSDNHFFDYEAKYLLKSTKEMCPAPINNDLEQELRNIARKAYYAVKAKSHARIDMIVSNGRIYVLEINTFPGLAPVSLFPKELKAAGLSLAEFIDKTLLNELSQKPT